MTDPERIVRLVAEWMPTDNETGDCATALTAEEEAVVRRVIVDG